MMAKESTKHVDFLDYVRGVAILAVFLFHSLNEAFSGANSLPWHIWFRDISVSKSFLVLLPFSFGWAGVAIFFVVSGFCIHVSFERQGQEWKSFFIRRFFRIYPPYLLAVLFFALIFPTTRLIFSHEHHDVWSQITNHLLLIHNFDAKTYYGINSSFWSIAVEVQLYLLYPVLLILVAKFGWRRSLIFIGVGELLIHILEGTLTTLICAGVSFGLKFPHFIFQITSPIYWLTVSPFAYWLCWAFGAVIADAFLKGRRLPFAQSSFPLWFLLTLLSYFFKPLGPFTFLLFAVLTAVAISKLLSGARPKVHLPGFFLTHLRQTGIWSYSIYLIHQPLLGPVSKIPSYFSPEATNNPLLKFSCCILAWFLIMPLGGLCYKFCELPSIAFGKRIIRKLEARFKNK